MHQRGGVAWLCKRSFLAQYSAIPRGQDSQLQVQDHVYTIIIGAKDGLNKIHVQSRSQLLSCPGHRSGQVRSGLHASGEPGFRAQAQKAQYVHNCYLHAAEIDK